MMAHLVHPAPAATWGPGDGLACVVPTCCCCCWRTQVGLEGQLEELEALCLQRGLAGGDLDG